MFYRLENLTSRQYSCVSYNRGSEQLTKQHEFNLTLLNWILPITLLAR